MSAPQVHVQLQPQDAQDALLTNPNAAVVVVAAPTTPTDTSLPTLTSKPPSHLIPTPVTTSKRSSKSKSKSGKMPSPTEHTNYNHLLNFTLPPRQSQQALPLPRRGGKRPAGGGMVWNKEKFLNAQYRFVMNPMGDYTVHFADPDIYFQWQDILQIIVPRKSALASASASKSASPSSIALSEEGATTCPICLSPPSAPRMTKCGHVFCFPCILHYLTLSEDVKGWNRCPICFDSVHEKHLKAVKWIDDDDNDAHPNLSDNESLNSPGSTLQMRFMQRPQLTTLALPRSATWPSEAIPPHQAPFHFLPDVFRFAKFMLATPDQLIIDLGRDLEELGVEKALLGSIDGGDLSVSFVELATRKVLDHLDRAVKIKECAGLAETIERTKWEAREISGGASASKDVHDGPSGRGPKSRRNLNPPPPSTSSYYFYQSTSGAPIFLHPLDIRILFSFYKDYTTFPDTIDIHVEACSSGTVDDELRKRFKYLSHLPEGAEVVLVEADLTDVVGLDGLKPFEGALKMRRSRRRDKERKEEREKNKAEEREKEKVMRGARELGAGPAPVVVEPDELWKWQEEEMEAELGLVPPALSSSGTATTSTSASSSAPHSRATTQEMPVSGAWGERSFASALHTPGRGRGTTNNSSRSQSRYADDYDFDDEPGSGWGDFQLAAAVDSATSRGGGGKGRGGGGGKKKRGRGMVVLGGSAVGVGGRRR